jgi:hypothetical protein
MSVQLQSAAAVGKRIKSIATRSAKLTKDIHDTAIQCLMHALPPSQGGHGDVTLIDRLAKALAKANAPEVFKNWVREYAPITWNGDNQVKLIPSTSKMFKPFDIEGADRNPYWENIETKKPELTLEKLVKLLQGLEKRVTKANDEGQIAEGEDVAAMLALAKRAQMIVGKPVEASEDLQLAA